MDGISAEKATVQLCSWAFLFLLVQSEVQPTLLKNGICNRNMQVKMTKTSAIQCFVDNLNKQGAASIRMLNPAGEHGYSDFLPSLHDPGNADEVVKRQKGDRGKQQMSKLGLDVAKVLDATVPEAVGCILIKQIFEIPPLEGAFTVPSCILIDKCGGCCHQLQECTPTEGGKRLRLIQVMRFFDLNGMGASRTDVVEVEEHSSCTCGCRIKEADCDANIHTYDKLNCQCVCRNMAASRSCPANRRWNPSTCSCECLRGSESCGVGYQFNSTNCMCSVQARKRYVDQPPVECGNIQRQKKTEVCANFQCRLNCLADGKPAFQACKCAYYDIPQNTGKTNRGPA